MLLMEGKFMVEVATRPRDYEAISTSRWWWGYIVAVAGTFFAALARWSLGQAVGDLPTYVTFYPVVFAAAIVGGTKPGLLALVLSLLAADLLFVEPVG
jgi:K+-sensing histidine kinase KdpD